MNCKPGDLAVVIRCTDATQHALGAFVQVIEYWDERVYTRAFGIDGWHTTWRCKPASGGAIVNWQGKRCKTVAIPDFALRPIRDPGDDARDEMLRPIDQTELV